MPKYFVKPVVGRCILSMRHISFFPGISGHYLVPATGWCQSAMRTTAFQRAWLDPCAYLTETLTIVNTPSVNAQSLCQRMEKFVALGLSMPITLVLDNARDQQCARVQTFTHQLEIKLLFLPTYSSNLNLIEPLWKFIDRACLNANYYSGFTAFTEAFQSGLNQTNTTHRQALTSWLIPNFKSF